MANRKDDVYIAVLKAVRQKVVEGTPLVEPDVVDELHREYPNIDKEIILRIFNHAAEGLGAKLTMIPEAYFQLMEYEELQQARETAQDANESSIRAFGLAFKAFAVSAVIGVASIGIGVASIIIAANS